MAPSEEGTQFLILVKGLPGSGKSTLAAALASRLRCPLVDKDDARDAFQAVVQQAPCVDWNALSYDVMFRTVARQLALGLSVVVDCPFARPQLYERACRLAIRTTGRPPPPPASLPAVAPLTAVTPAPAAAAAGAATEAVASAAARGAVAVHGKAAALVVLVDVECGDEGEWRRRVEERGLHDAGTERCHKPGSWAALQALLASYDGCWKWSTDGSVRVPHRVSLCTDSASTEGCVNRVLSYLETLRNAQGADDNTDGPS